MQTQQPIAVHERVRRGARGLTALLLVVLAAHGNALAEPWQGRLQGGAEVTVDPETRRATGVIDGQERPLWDGVHRLEDGSTVIVRDGVAVPTEPMYERWQREDEPEAIYAGRFCNQLVRKTCGFDEACSAHAACLRARTLLTDEMREQRQSPSAGVQYPQTAASERCRTALDDPAFPACASLDAASGDSRCRDLVVRVCGAGNECAGSQACDAAQQLQGLETQERLTNADPAALSRTGQQCLEAMNNSFFAPCGSR